MGGYPTRMDLGLIELWADFCEIIKSAGADDFTVASISRSHCRWPIPYCKPVPEQGSLLGSAWRLGFRDPASSPNDTPPGGGGTFGVVLEASVIADPVVPIQVALLAFNPAGNNTRAVWPLALDNQLKWSQDGWGGLLNKQQLLYVNPKLNASEAAVSMKVCWSYY